MTNDPNVVSTGDFGLDHYEPKFFYPLGDWLGFGTFEVQLTFDVDDFAQDIFYFCHVSTPRPHENGDQFSFVQTTRVRANAMDSR